MQRLPLPHRCTGPLLAVLLALVTPPAIAQDADADAAPQGPGIEDTRAMLDTWIELRQTISKTQAQWKLTREMMDDRIELMKANIQDVRQQIEEKKNELDSFESDIAALEAREQKLIEAADKLAELVESIEARTLALVERAPAPLVEQVKPIAVQIPGYKSDAKKQEADKREKQSGNESANEDQIAGADDEKQGPPLSRRTENVIGVLYLFNKYATKIEQTSELVDQPDGSSLTVDSVYLGHSYAYYVDDSSTAGGFGWGASGGWAWTPIDEPAVAAQVRKAVSVFNSDQPAAYVGLPAEVK